jgi:ABC-type uncharacterized transport system permease subunit
MDREITLGAIFSTVVVQARVILTLLTRAIRLLPVRTAYSKKFQRDTPSPRSFATARARTALLILIALCQSSQPEL